MKSESESSRHSLVPDSAAAWTVAHHAPLSMGFPREEYHGGLPHAPPGETLSNPGNEHMSLRSPALKVGFFTISVTWEAPLLFLVFPFKRIEVVKHFFETLVLKVLVLK